MVSELVKEFTHAEDIYEALGTYNVDKRNRLIDFGDFIDDVTGFNYDHGKISTEKLSTEELVEKYVDYNHPNNVNFFPFVEALNYVVSVMKLKNGDLVRIEHWGTSPDGKVKLLDYGLVGEGGRW